MGGNLGFLSLWSGWMKRKIEKFLNSKKDEIDKIVAEYPEKKSLIVDYQELAEYDTEIAEDLRNKPDEVITIFNDVFSEIRGPVVDEDHIAEKPRFYVRFKNLPKEKGYTVMIRDITSDYIGKLIAVDGVVTKITDVLPKVYLGMFICNRCNERNPLEQDKRILQEPTKCSVCGKHEFRFVPEESKFIDIQELEIQEPLESLKGGEQTRKINLWTEEDMTDVVTAGDKVILTGILRLLPPKQRGAIYYKYLEINYIETIGLEFEAIEISEEEEKKIKKMSKDPKLYEKIINSIAPSIYGYREIKEAVALQLFGGRPGKKLPDRTSVRADIHLLLIGEPGVAKSRMLQYVTQIAPRSLYVASGATGAGLTATAEKDEFAEGAWTLKAGALVLAGGGIAAIDEFDKISKEDRGAMHEAMEQQTISVAKAGMVTRFKANTSILAASNPKWDRFDKFKPLADQFDIAPTLMSRFDLIFPIKDVVDKETDRHIAEHIIKMHRTEKEMEEIGPEIETDVLRKYISYARKHIFPVLSEEAAKKLMDYYVNLRSASSSGAVSATPRQLEALVRLAEASAKIRLNDTVTVDDADRAIVLTNYVLKEVAYDETLGGFDIDRIGTSHPKSVRDKITAIEEIIRELIDSDSSKTAAYKDIMEKVQEKKFEKYEAERIIEELRMKGVIYEPKPGKFKLTEE